MDEKTLMVDIEINQKDTSALEPSIIEENVYKYFVNKSIVTLNSTLFNTGVLPSEINYIRICELRDDSKATNIDIKKNSVGLLWYTYKIHVDIRIEKLSLDEDEEEARITECLNLPHQAFEGLWETLIFDENVKGQLLDYVKTALRFSTNNVSKQVIGWNSVVLLHGPPGTGKTSLAKALSQKIAIRLYSTYPECKFFEVNSQLLFSRWFSESSKRILKLFDEIKKHITRGTFVIILIDEVESLVSPRGFHSERQPIDVLHSVNTILTNIDALKIYSNFLILSTSNITKAIDIAFADRADIKQYIGHPSKWTIYEILRSCIAELINSKLLHSSPKDLLDSKTCQSLWNGDLTEFASKSRTLLLLSEKCEGLSGRTLRKVPFLAFSEFTDKPFPSLERFLQAMEAVVLKINSDNKHFSG